MSESDGSAPSDRLRERAEQSRVKLWLFLEADRWVVSLALFGIVFVVFTGTGYLLPAAEAAIRGSDSVDTLFQGLLTATITGVTLVLTLNQLVLSQELGSVTEQREQMEGAMAFRSDVSDVIQAPVSPSRPAQFLRALIQVASTRATEVDQAVADISDEEVQASITDLTGSIIENAERVSEGLDDARFGEFDVISSALNFNYSWKIFRARYLRESYDERLPEEGKTGLEELTDVLELFGPAREHFKTLYFQWELIDLSRRMLAAALPALLVSGTVLLFFNDQTFTVSLFGVELLVAFLSLAVTVSVLPFLILLAYVLRIATVAKQTLSIGPFILREAEDVTDVEWNT